MLTWRKLKNAAKIKTMRTIDKIITKVSCKNGAPMGRGSNDVNFKPTDRKVFDCAVPLSQGYDKGGAYWGYPDNIRVEYSKDLSYLRYYRTY